MGSKIFTRFANFILKNIPSIVVVNDTAAFYLENILKIIQSQGKAGGGGGMHLFASDSRLSELSAPAVLSGNVAKQHDKLPSGLFPRQVAFCLRFKTSPRVKLFMRK